MLNSTSLLPALFERQDLDTATSGKGTPAQEVPGLPEGGVNPLDQARLTRRGLLRAKREAEEMRASAFKEYRSLPAGPEKQALHREIQACAATAQDLERNLDGQFVPAHSLDQFLSPRVFFVSPLFSVRSKSVLREKHIEMTLPAPQGRVPIRYVGPELRQSDGRVFLALLNMLRDVRVGTAVTIQPELVCKALFNRYDGASRKKLCAHIQRLQQGLMIFETFSVQLCLRFEYPKTGPWSVSLDPQIAQLFRVSPEVWLTVHNRLSLPEGLATWLYTYIASQTRLIPTKLTVLRELCGSEANEKGFENRFRDAMHQLAERGILEAGWFIKKGQVHWLKLRESLDGPAAL